MPIKKRKDTPENREFWNFVEKVSKNVADSFPAWKRGDVDHLKQPLTKSTENNTTTDFTDFKEA